MYYRSLFCFCQSCWNASRKISGLTRCVLSMSTEWGHLPTGPASELALDQKKCCSDLLNRSAHLIPSTKEQSGWGRIIAGGSGRVGAARGHLSFKSLQRGHRLFICRTGGRPPRPRSFLQFHSIRSVIGFKRTETLCCHSPPTLSLFICYHLFTDRLYLRFLSCHPLMQQPSAVRI